MGSRPVSSPIAPIFQQPCGHDQIENGRSTPQPQNSQKCALAVFLREYLLTGDQRLWFAMASDALLLAYTIKTPSWNLKNCTSLLG